MSRDLRIRRDVAVGDLRVEGVRWLSPSLHRPTAKKYALVEGLFMTSTEIDKVVLRCRSLVLEHVASGDLAKGWRSVVGPVTLRKARASDLYRRWALHTAIRLERVLDHYDAPTRLSLLYADLHIILYEAGRGEGVIEVRRTRGAPPARSRGVTPLTWGL